MLAVSDQDLLDQWILEFGCSFHMTPRRGWLSNYESKSSGKVLMGNNQSCNVLGVGSIKIRLNDETFKILIGVRHIPDLKRILISLGVFDSTGYSYKAQRGVLETFNGILMALKERSENGLYVLEGEKVFGESYKT